MGNMGLDFGLPMPDGSSKTCKRKFRWLLKIDEISAKGINALPPLRSARPSISFKETEIPHLNENIFYPRKPDWRPISLVLYDVKRNNHPIFEWINQLYDPSKGSWNPVVGSNYLKTADLELYDAVGGVVEKWVFEHAWPQTADFGELDMGNSDIVTCELTLRYARAYIEKPTNGT